ncbi:accessory gene regulator ArgB-like protein [Thermoanaerobacterium sp. DL9XJH110]|uniref:accessory gene regulator ArgB-like protein n=1 Tax=Thermoanaerobacterium sp. DL9XJH110 TaxID=3386643 RepID=UPI003BB5C13F
MLQSCSRMLSRIIVKELKSERFEPEILEYGLQIMLGSLFKFCSIVFFSILLKTFPETMASLAAFALLRHFAGGVHCKTYGMCYITGVAMFLANGLVVKYAAFPADILIWVNNLWLVLSLFITLKWVPAGTEKKAVSDGRTRERLKGMTMIILGAVFILTNALYLAGRANYLEAVFLGVVEEMLFVTPFGYRLLKASYH